MADPRAKLLHEWDVGKDRFRLIARAKWTSGYEDEYLVEKLGQDGYGEPRWDKFYSWDAKEHQVIDRTMTVLVAAIKGLVNAYDPDKGEMSWGL